MSRKLCRMHLEAYRALKISMEAEWIGNKEKPICTYAGCMMPAMYEVKILTDGVVA